MGFVASMPPQGHHVRHCGRVDLDRVLRSCLQEGAEERGNSSATPGIVMVAGTNEVGAVHAIGSAVIEYDIPLTTDTPMYAASLAKLVTGLCAHRLVSTGQLDLDEPIGRWFPTLVAGDHITVRHLLMHRSGLPEYHALRLLGGYGVEDRLVADDVRRMVDRMSPWFEAGSKVSYNNTNYALAAMIVADVSGEPFAAAARRLVFEPAGMSGATVRADPAASIEGMAAGYFGRTGAWRRALQGVASVGDGGMWWSGNDLLALGRALLAPGLPTATGESDRCIEALTERRPLLDGSLPALATGCSVSADSSWFGGLAEFAGFRAELRVYPDLGVAIGAMSNRQDARLSTLLDAAATELGAPFHSPSAPVGLRGGQLPRGVLVGLGGAPWKFDQHSDADRPEVRSRVVVGDLTFHLREGDGGWQVVERPSTVVGWDGSDLVVRDDVDELARLQAIGGAAPSAAVVRSLAGWWWCEAASAALRVVQGAAGAELHRGQAAPELLVPVGDREGRWVLAAPWGLLEFDHDGRTGRVVLHRAEGIVLQRMHLTTAVGHRPG